MAASIGGGGAAYQQLRTPDDGLNQALQNVGAQAERRNRGLREEGQALKDKIDKTTQAFKTSLEAEKGAFEATIVGQDSFDDVSRNVANLGLERFIDYGEQANELWDKGDYKGAKEIQQRQQKVMNSFNNWEKNSAEVGKSVMKVKEMQENNTLSPVDNGYPQLAEAILKNDYVVGYDENDNMTIQWKEKDYETGEEKLVTKKASDIYSNSYDAYRKIPIQEKGGILDQWKEKFGVIRKDENTGNYNKTSKGWTPEAKAALDPSIDAFLADPENMSYALYEASGGTVKKKGNPEVYGEDQAFSPEDKQMAKDYLKKQALGLEKREESLKYTGAAERARHNRAMENRPKPKSKKEEQLGKLRFDVKRAVESGDYTVLMDTEIDKKGKVRTVTDVVVSPDGNRIVMSFDKGTPVTIPNTERAIMEYKLRNKPEYKGVDVTEAMGVEPDAYRNSSVSASSIDNVVNSLYNEEGKPKVDDEDILKRLNETLGITGEDNFTLFGNSLTIEGIEIDTSSRESIKQGLKKVMNARKQNKENLRIKYNY